jgi:hypothetical protein
MSNLKPGKGRGRKPVHTEGVNLYGQDAIWAAIRDLGEFKQSDIEMWIFKRNLKSANEGTIRSYISRLTKGGYVELLRKEHYRGKTYLHYYKLVKNSGVESPRLKKDGTPSMQGFGRENMWRTMKIIKEFNFRELAINASTDKVIVNELEAASYIRFLVKAKYISLKIKACNSGKPARYRFNSIMNTGPKPPQIQKSKSVFDPNLNKVVWEPANNKKEMT